MEFLIVVFLFAANLMLAVIAWCLSTLNQSVREHRNSTITIGAITHDLQKENLSELTRARLRAR